MKELEINLWIFVSKKIDSVTKEDIARVSKDIFSGPTLLVEIVKSE